MLHLNKVLNKLLLLGSWRSKVSLFHSKVVLSSHSTLETPSDFLPRMYTTEKNWEELSLASIVVEG